MTSRALPSPPAASTSHRRRHAVALFIAAAVGFPSAIFLILLLLFLYFRFSHRRSPTLPFDSPVPPRLRLFSFQDLRAATSNFDPSRSLGRGASAAVYRGILPDGKSVAVKRLENPPSRSPFSPHREFQNELQVLADLPLSPFVVSLLGYCLEGKRRPRGLLVYEYMSNGSLQEALFGSSRPLIDWDRRFRIILDVARALDFLHLHCDPPVIHGDIKPSNVLLGPDFQAKIADFGLSRRRTVAVALASSDMFMNHETKVNPKDTCDDELGCSVKCSDLSQSSPFDDSTRIRGKDWWWKQDESGELCSRDYVREWLGNQICSSKNLDWEDDRKSSPEFRTSIQMDRSEKWSLDETLCGDLDCHSHEKTPQLIVQPRFNKNDRKMREWWKEEYFAEINKRGKNCSNDCNSSRRNGRPLNADSSFRKGWKKRKSQSVGSEMFNNDLYSKELSSTTSMRGTVCYVAPENGGLGHPLEKADIYSFGVLILVIVSGRRPLHVQESPMKLERANLISWCRQLAHSGDVMDILDEKLKDSHNKDQVNLCIKLALLCLQRTPDLRPDSGDVVKILKGEMEIPVLPLESSASPTSKVFSRSMWKNKEDGDSKVSSPLLPKGLIRGLHRVHWRRTRLTLNLILCLPRSCN